MNALEANPTLLTTVVVDEIFNVCALNKSPGEVAELPCVFWLRVKVVPECVNVVTGSKLAGVVTSTIFIPFASPVADDAVMDEVPLENIEWNETGLPVGVTDTELM
jgi:hypothetical protein